MVENKVENATGVDERKGAGNEVKKDESKETKNEAEKKPELERVYVIPLRKRLLKVPRYKRAKRAINAIKDFLVRHMRVENRDIRKIKINSYLNEEIWHRGIKNPPAKIKVNAKKVAGIVYAELAEIPKIVQYKMNRDKKFLERIAKNEFNKPKSRTVESDKSDSEKKEEKVVVKSGTEEQKKETKAAKHNESGAHPKKTMPRRQALKR
jgi:large subunit ribosomal protein L31e